MQGHNQKVAQDEVAQENKEQNTQDSRRAFLKVAGIGGVGLAIGAMSGCSSGVEQKEVIKGKSKKQEVLYRSDTKYWQTYFSVAK